MKRIMVFLEECNCGCREENLCLITRILFDALDNFDDMDKDTMEIMIDNSVKKNCIGTIKYLESHFTNFFDKEHTLYCAVYERNLDIVKYVVENGADVQANNNVACNLAVEKGFTEIVDYLLQNGAN